LKILAEAGREVGLPVVTEVMHIDQMERVAAVADCVQIGARNTQNFDLLKEAGKAGKPGLLKPERVPHLFAGHRRRGRLPWEVCRYAGNDFRQP
jgi:3-deoxy-D-arabino-heptulosonate 7-phosphate (DAHP) synthase